jgi:hypothetical protein
MIDGQSVSLSWCKTPNWGPWPDFIFLSGSCRHVDALQLLWWEDGPVVYNCCWASTSNHSRSKSSRTHDHVIVSNLRHLQPEGPGPHIYIPRNGAFQSLQVKDICNWWSVSQCMGVKPQALTVQSFLSKSSRTHDHITVSNLRHLHPEGSGPHIYIPRNRAFQSLQDKAMLHWWSVSVLVPSPSPDVPPIKLKLNYDWESYSRQSVGQSVLASGDHLGPVTNFSFSLKFSLDIWEFVIL